MAKGRRRRQAIPEAPTCNCALLCDDVLVSQGKAKHILQGVIGVIFVPEFPAVIGGFVSYVRVSNVYGAQKIVVNLENTRTGAVLFEFRVDMPTRSDPLGVYTLVVPVPPVEVAEAGRYMFSASSGGVPLAQSPIVIQGPPPGANE
jgi:hypothetical protein